MKIALAALALTLALPSAPAAETLHTFKKIQVTDQFWAEGADIGDFNHDGKRDVCYGPFWYAGPDFKQRFEYRPATATFKTKNADGKEVTLPGYEGAQGVNNAYSDCFLIYAYDFNQDGWDDIIVYGLPSTEVSWYENPKGREGHWPKHTIFDVLDNESPGLADVTGDGRPEILCCSRGFLGYVEADWKTRPHPGPSTP